MKYIFEELKNELFQKVEARMMECGFKFDRKSGYFSKSMSDVRWSFGIGFIKHPSDFDVTANVSVGLDSLENLLNEANKSFPKKGFSLGAELGNISEGKQKRWKVSNQKDLDSVSISILEAFTKIGLPYLKKYSVLETALEAISGDDKASWLHSPFHDARAMRALGLAFLLKKHEKFHALAESKTAFLTKRNDPNLQRFLEFRQKLELKLSEDNQ